MQQNIVIGISGASGVILGLKVVKKILENQPLFHVYVVMTKDAKYTALEEMGKAFATDSALLGEFPEEHRSRVTICGIRDFGSPIASGTFITHGMAIVPCSMASLAAVAMGLSDNLLRRAADVTMKEKRPLVIVPREAPLSLIHLQHMVTLAQMGAAIIPPQPAWYTHPKTIDDVEDHIVGRVLDMLGINTDYARWTGV